MSHLKLVDIAPRDRIARESFQVITKTLRYSGGGGDNGDMEARIARLESDMSHISKTLDEVKTDVREIRKEATRDFRTLFGALIFVALGIAGMMAKGFHWL